MINVSTNYTAPIYTYYACILHIYKYILGWQCGVHSPLSIMNTCSTIKKMKSEKYQIVYIIMLRSPFERFISETLYWNEYNAPDWGGINISNELNNKNKNHPQQDMKNETQLIDNYLNLPSNIMIHNRMIKMIGGSTNDYDMNWKPKLNVITSRWKGYNTSSYYQYLYQSIITYFQSNELYLLGLEEKFNETLCILEFIYGNSLQFHWNSNQNSHKTTINYNYTSYKYNQYSMNHLLYQKWLEKNNEDYLLYQQSIEIFQIQFEIVLNIINNTRLLYDNERKKQIPHCLSFL